MPTIQVPAGQINLKGPQAPTGVGRWLQPGSLAFTGLVLTLVISGGTTISNGAGALAWQGLAPSIRTGDLSVAIPAGSLVIKGPARPEAIPQLQAGAIGFTGRVLNVAVDAPGSAITIAAGSLVFTGQVPERIANFSLAVPAGSLVLSGQYIDVAFSPLGCGQLVWQGLAPTVGTQSVSIAIPKGTITFGQIALTPTLQFNFAIAVPAGQVVLAGREPNAGTPFSIVIPAGALQLTGVAPTIDAVIAIPVGAAQYTGYAPTLDTATAAPGVPAGAIAFTGYGFELIHSNGTVISSTVRLSRTVSGTGTITRTVTSEVSR